MDLHYSPREQPFVLARIRWAGNWLLPPAMKRAAELGWDRIEPLTLHDMDGLAIAGFVPTKI